MTPPLNTDYRRGYAYGEFIRQEQAAGKNPDPRWEFAVQAQWGTLTEFMRGFIDGLDSTVTP